MGWRLGDTIAVVGQGMGACTVPCAHMCMNSVQIHTAASACVLPFCLVAFGAWQIIPALLYLLA